MEDKEIIKEAEDIIIQEEAKLTKAVYIADKVKIKLSRAAIRGAANYLDKIVYEGVNEQTLDDLRQASILLKKVANVLEEVLND